MSNDQTPNIPENTLHITLSLTEANELKCGFGWHIPDPETDEGNYLYMTGLGLLWMLTKNMEGLTRLGATYEASREAEEAEEDSHEAEILEFPLTPTKH